MVKIAAGALIACLAFAAAAAPPPPAAYSTALKKGRARARTGDAAGAVVSFRAALAAKPDDAVALSELGAAALQAGDLALAEQSTRAAVAAATTPQLKGAALYNLGRICEKKGDRAGAVDAYRQSLQARRNGTVWRALGALDAGAAAPFDPLAPQPMKGPFASPAEFLAQLPNNSGRLVDDDSPALANPPPPYRAARVLATTDDPAREPPAFESLSLAVQLPSGWFVCPTFATVQNAHDPLGNSTGSFAGIEIAAKDLLAGGAPEVSLRYLERSAYVSDTTTEAEDATWLAIVGVGASGKPSCVTGIVVDWLPARGSDFVAEEARARDPKLVTVPIEFAADAINVPALPKAIPARIRDAQLGRHLVTFP